MRLVNRRGAGERSFRPIFGQVVEDTSGTPFETNQVITDTPTLYIDLSIKAERFLLEEVYWWVNPTAAETYQLLLFEKALADDTLSRAAIVFDSGPLMVDSQGYIAGPASGKLPRICDLGVEGRLYYMTLWTGAPGNTPGILKVGGQALVGKP